MADSFVTLRGYNRVRNGLRRLASEHREETDDTIRQWAQGQRAKLKGTKYPSPRRARQPFKTARQRRYFFWALGQGIISVPYRRTGGLANSWRVEREGAGSYVIANSRPYAHWVVGREDQSKYHEPNWWVAQDIVEKDTPKLTGQLTERLEGLFDA